MKNDFEIRGDITAIFLNSPKHGNSETLIDTFDLDKVKNFPNRWGMALNKEGYNFYCRGKVYLPNGKSKTIYLHRFITDCPKGLLVDHYDHDTLNNTRKNLRLATPSENQQNRKGAEKDSSTGIRGVHWIKRDKVYLAKLRLNGEEIRLGYYKKVEEAEKAVIEARTRYMPFSKEIIIQEDFR